MEKTWFMASVEWSTHGKDIMALLIYSSIGKGMALWKGNCHGFSNFKCTTFMLDENRVYWSIKKCKYYICKSTVHTYISAKTTFSKKRAQNQKIKKWIKHRESGIAYTVWCF